MFLYRTVIHANIKILVLFFFLHIHFRRQRTKDKSIVFCELFFFLWSFLIRNTRGIDAWWLLIYVTIPFVFYLFIFLKFKCLLIGNVCSIIPTCNSLVIYFLPFRHCIVCPPIYRFWLRFDIFMFFFLYQIYEYIRPREINASPINQLLF
jgi:hypothetical protein